MPARVARDARLKNQWGETHGTTNGTKNGTGPAVAKIFLLGATGKSR
jgi:hypothetical protein